MSLKNKKSLGQHWLKNRTVLDEIATLAKADFSVELCLEIGPGLGTLTSSLLKKFSEVIAIEYDEQLAQKLPGQFPGKNLQVEHADILDLDLTQTAAGRPYVVAGNIPYYITSPIIRHILSARQLPRRAVLLIQKEVAQRIAAAPGKHTYLSLLVQSQAEVELGPIVKAQEFTPPPQVDSQIIILDPLESPQLSTEALLLAQAAFSNPRKKLATNLANSPRNPNRLSKADWQRVLNTLTINPDARASDLDLWDWEELANFQTCLKPKSALK